VFVHTLPNVTAEPSEFANPLHGWLTFSR